MTPANLPTVMHILDGYLPVTENWLYRQMIGITRYRVVAVPGRLYEAQSFPLDNLCVCPRLFAAPRSWTGRAANRVAESAFCVQSRRQARVAKRFQASLLHAHFGQTGYNSLAAKRFAGLPLITSFYGRDACLLPGVHPIWRRRYTRLFAEGDLFLAEGNHMKSTLVSLGCPQEKVVVHHLGVDLNALPFAIRRPDDDGTIRILAVGRFTEKKGLSYAVRAFAMVARERVGVRLVLVGDGRGKVELAEKAELLRLVHENSLGDRVRFTGYVGYPEFLSLIGETHICIAPSVTAGDGDAEGGAPVCLIEMSASGMPVIATRHCDIGEVVLDGVSGFLAPERDVDSLSERLLHLIDHPEIWPAMGASGRKHIEKNYDAARQAVCLERTYDSLLGCAGPDESPC